MTVRTAVVSGCALSLADVSTLNTTTNRFTLHYQRSEERHASQTQIRDRHIYHKRKKENPLTKRSSFFQKKGSVLIRLRSSASSPCTLNEQL